MTFPRDPLFEMTDAPPPGEIPQGSVRAHLLWTVCLFLFFTTVINLNLGAPALFDPDEGRSAEIAREILLLNDWITPHYNFTSRLDKPILFYSLVASSFRAFGLSEWSARFPSAISALATLAVVYLFSSKFLGLWQGRWAALIMLSSAGFIAMSGTAIFDMALTFFVTAALSCFYYARSARSATQRRIACMLFYAALGAATLIKGMIGLAVPGMVIACYLLLTAQWSLVRRMELPLGICIFLLIALPWYLWAEIRNPGYLRYFVLEEHLLRFVSSQFGRTQPWFYYFLVLALGFLPWTLLLPLVIQRVWRRFRSHAMLFLVLWIVVPFVFFSLSASKHPHYLLPILPPLSMVAGTGITARMAPSQKRQWLLSVPILTMIVLTLASLAVIGFYSGQLPQEVGTELRAAVPYARPTFLIGLPLALASSAVVIWKRLWRMQAVLFLMTAVAFFLFYVGNLPIKTAVSHFRSSKELANLSAPLIPPGSQAAVYNTYLSGLPFYLRLEQPFVVVWSGKGHSLMGSRYVASGLSKPAPGYPEVISTFEEFEESLDDSRQDLFIFVQPKHVERVTDGKKSRFEELLRVDDVLLLKYDPRAPNTRSATEKVQQLASDPLSATYRVQRRNITLRNGRSEIPYSPDSAAKIKTAVLGNPVPGDFDADGDRDAALLLVHDPGGSGTFYYVAVAINEHGQYRGTNAVLLGDRIVPKDIVIRDGAVEVDYFDRPADAPMHSRPSVEKQSYLMLEGGVLSVVGGRHDLILVDTPAPGDTVASPLKVKGRARGSWYFEGDFPLRLEDRNGNVIARGYATATEPWMTTEFVPFEGTLTFTGPAEENSGILILGKDNPSSRRELDDELRIPVFFE